MTSRSAFPDLLSRRMPTSVVPSSPLVPAANDPTLMFTNAGMVQFKKRLHPGLEKRPLSNGAHLLAEMRARPAASTTTSTMSAIPARHHNLFSRCSAISLFGDYFKDPCDRTCVEPDHQGVRAAGRSAAGDRPISMTIRPFNLWKKIAGPCPDSKIHPHRRFPDNFWQMGDTPGHAVRAFGNLLRPRLAHFPEAPPGSPDGRRRTASSRSGNLVFMQYEQLGGRRACRTLPRSRRSTPAWGWERIAGRPAGYPRQLFRSILFRRA